MNWALLQNSLLVSGVATLLALGLGFVGALWLVGLPAGWRRWFLCCAVVALALPPFLVTNCWLALAGQGGVWRSWWPFGIFSLGGTAWILALLYWPVSLFLVLGAWQPLEASHLEADPALRGGKLVRWLLLPMARPALALGALLTFVLVFNNFAVPAILQTKVFPAELWVSFNTTFNYAEALRLSLPMLIVPGVLLCWLGRRGFAWPRLNGTVPPAAFRRQLGSGVFLFAGTLTAGLIALSVGLPIAELVSAPRTWIEMPGAVAAGGTAIWNSFFNAALAATLCAIAALAVWNVRGFGASWLGFFAPGVLLGVGLIHLFNRPWTSAFYQSAGVVVLALMLRYFALSWTGARRAMQSMDPSLTEAARLDGARGWALLRHVHGPQIAPALGAVWYVTYLLCLWDVETLVLIAPPGGETLSLRIFNLLHYGHNTQVNALCLILLSLAATPLIVASALKMIANQRVSSAPSKPALAVILVALAGAGCDAPPANETRVQSRLFDRVQLIGGRGTALGQFNKPRSLALDAMDNLYVVDMTGRVQKFSSNGVFLAYWQMPQTDLGKAKGMCRDAQGNIVVVEPHYQRVNHFSPEGKLISQWGVRGTNCGQITLPRAVAVNSRGEILLSEYTVVDRVQHFSKDGQKLFNCFGQPGTRPGEFNRAEGLGLDPQDRIYVADSCNHRVQVFAPDGKFLRAYGRAGRGAGEMSYPYDVQVDAEGFQFVCEFGNSRVQIFGSDGQSVELLGKAGAAPGEFNNPWALALDSQGNLFVADSRNHRVQKFLRKKPLVSGRASSPATRLDSPPQVATH